MSTSVVGDRVFDRYARYYDLLYRDKDYAEEARFVDDQLRRFGVPGGRVLELGSGTGRHAGALARHGWRVHGIDRSDTMIAEAQRRRDTEDPTVRELVSFGVGDIATLRLPETFDAAVSLFHVFSYFVDRRALQTALDTAAAHVRPGGVLLFDFWFGPGVLSQPPATRVKRLRDATIDVTRIAEPTLDVCRNVVTVDFDIFVTERASGQTERFGERHQVRYWFLPEVEESLDGAGFERLTAAGWPSDSAPDARSWYAWVAARRR